MNVSILRTFCVEIYKTLNDFNPSFMNNIFKSKINGSEARDKGKLNLDIPKRNQKTFGYKSLKVLGPKIWNNLPYHLKSYKNFDSFENLLKKICWKSECNLCKKKILLTFFMPRYYLFSLFYFYIENFLLKVNRSAYIA